MKVYGFKTTRHMNLSFCCLFKTVSLCSTEALEFTTQAGLEYYNCDCDVYNSLFLYLLLLLLFVCEGSRWVCAMVCLQQSEDNFQGSVFSIFHRFPGSNYRHRAYVFCPLSHLTGSKASLMRYKSESTKFIHFKCTSQGILVCWYSLQSPSQSRVSHFYHTKAWFRWANTFCFSLLLSI